jgi:citrate synthase
MTTRWITAEEAQARLGVKLQSLYAYASRGMISARQDGPDARRSLYAADDIARLIQRKNRRRIEAAPAPRAELAPPRAPALVSGLTAVTDGDLRYRGRAATELAQNASLEEVARLLWGCDEDPFAGLAPHPLTISGADARIRIFALLAQRAAQDPATSGRPEAALKREAASVLADVVDAAAGAMRTMALHNRLARSWRAEGFKAEMIRRALVLAADQEAGDASNFAARVAASTGASLAASALAGLSAFSAPLQGGGAARVSGLLAEARRASSPRAAILNRLGHGLDAPGFGDPQFPQGDPRAQALRAAMPWSDELTAVAEAGEAVTGARPNFDFALVAMCRTLGLPADAPTTLVTVARTAGWLGHALEQAASGDRIRPRVRYVGPAAANGLGPANDAAA